MVKMNGISDIKTVTQLKCFWKTELY